MAKEIKDIMAENDKKPTKAEIDIQAIIAENEALKQKLETKEVEEKKVADPMSGVGEPCEAYKISVAEAWQVRRVQSQDGRSMVMEDTPKGFRMRKGANGFYVVGHENEDPQKCEYIANCHTNYTKQYDYSMKKLASAPFGEKPPQGKLYLCEHHAMILVGK